VDELQEALAQVTKGMAALAAWPQSGRATPPVAASSVGSVQGADASTLVSRSTTQSQGVGCKIKTGHWSGYKWHTRELDPCWICKQLGHWARECDKCKKPAIKSAEVNGVSCLLVSRCNSADVVHTDGARPQHASCKDHLGRHRRQSHMSDPVLPNSEEASSFRGVR